MIALVFLLGVIIACNRSSALTNPLLESLLNASTEEKFNDQFYLHGPVREEELPAIFEATASRTEYRYLHDGKNPIGDFEGRIRGKDAVEFAEKLA